MVRSAVAALRVKGWNIRGGNRSKLSTLKWGGFFLDTFQYVALDMIWWDRSGWPTRRYDPLVVPNGQWRRGADRQRQLGSATDWREGHVSSIRICNETLRQISTARIDYDYEVIDNASVNARWSMRNEGMRSQLTSCGYHRRVSPAGVRQARLLGMREHDRLLPSHKHKHSKRTQN